MRLLTVVLSYVIAICAVAGGAAGVLIQGAGSAARMAPVPQEASVAAPRIQAWLDRKAEERAFVERERAAAIAEKERLQALRMSIPSASEQPVLAREAERRNAEQQEAAARRERAARAREIAKLEAKRQLRLKRAEAERAMGYTPEPRWSAYPSELLSQRDRSGL
jgi:hypothetical protein